MTRFQSNLVKGVSLGALGIAFGFGSAWIETKRDIASKVDKAEFVEHLDKERARAVQESQVDSTLLRLFRQHADADCVGEKNPYRRQLLDCDSRNIK